VGVERAEQGALHGLRLVIAAPTRVARFGPIASGPPAAILPDCGATYETYAQIIAVPPGWRGED